MLDSHGRTIAEVLEITPFDQLRGKAVACRDPECKSWVVKSGSWIKHYHWDDS